MSKGLYNASKKIVITLHNIQGISRLSGTDRHGLTWTQFEVDYLAEQEDGECVECHDILSSGWVCMDGGDEICAKHVLFDTKHTPSRSTKAVPSSHSKWTRQTYEMVAQCIRDVYNITPADGVSNSVARAIADNLAVQFHLDNANFDRDRFIQACTLVNKRGPISRGGDSD